MDNYKQKLILLCVLLFGCVLTSIGVEYFAKDDEPIQIPPSAFVEQKLPQTEQANISQEGNLQRRSLKNNQVSVSQAKFPKTKATVEKQLKESPKLNVPININTASVAELDGLPGIGPVIAQRIVEHRQEQPFKSIEEIMLVKGIGKKKFAKLREMITVE